MTSRVQLALNVSDIDQAVAFYQSLFRTPPAKREPGYANFAIDNPPLKLVLIENPGAVTPLNHLGVEVFDTSEVAAAHERLKGHGLPVLVEEAVTCCYAVQDKVWVNDPDGTPWETYVVLDHADSMGRCDDEACSCA
jgi:catechol 2,3-dioxygenase-like lactoylglutathione lyase family enzyme